MPHPRLHISYPILALSFTVIFATGAIDDIFQLTPKQKLAGQVLAALIACMGGLRIGVIVNPFAPGEIMLGWLAYPITVIYLVAFTNIINLIDGLDGLATGICGIASFTMFSMAVLSGRIDAAALSIAKAAEPMASTVKMSTRMSTSTWLIAAAPAESMMHQA